MQAHAPMQHASAHAPNASAHTAGAKAWPDGYRTAGATACRGVRPGGKPHAPRLAPQLR